MRIEENVFCSLCCHEVAASVTQQFKDPKGNFDHFEVLRCHSCGLLFTHPRPDKDILSQYYEDDYSSWYTAKNIGGHFNSSWHNWTFSRYFGYEKFRQNLSPIRRLVAISMSMFHSRIVTIPQKGDGGKLLDIGCGSGQYLNLMRHLGWEVRGVEPSAIACKLSRERWGIEPKQGWIEDISERDFDIVTMIGVIEHLENPVDALRKIRSILKPGGRLFLTTHDISGPGPKLFGENWVGWEVPQHLFFFDKRTIHLTMELSGYRNITVKGHFRSIDIFNTTSPNRFMRYVTFFASAILEKMGLCGGLVVEASA